MGAFGFNRVGLNQVVGVSVQAEFTQGSRSLSSPSQKWIQVRRMVFRCRRNCSSFRK